MDWNAAYARDREPTWEEIGAFISSPLWDQLNQALVSRQGAKPKVEHSRCGMLPGWNVKYRKKGKNLFTLYPRAGYFHVLLVVSERLQPETDLFVQTCGSVVKKAYAETAYFQGSKWLSLDVESDTTLDDILGLTKFRLM